eukprot:TRINITY_DN56035_c0_g1_i1.p1 TRINITY_DN56035_c0_g1~~TRINITY_DN56035_c0_g1_i1.p1  ORF type:complete len:206 (-),score=65.67 TRINITY_DN56035_c0_g1_i1:31-648(-)
MSYQQPFDGHCGVARSAKSARTGESAKLAQPGIVASAGDAPPPKLEEPEREPGQLPSLFFTLYPLNAKKVDMSEDYWDQRKQMPESTNPSVLGVQATPAAADELKRKLLDALGGGSLFSGAETAAATAPAAGSAAAAPAPAPAAAPADNFASLSIKELKQRIVALGAQVAPGVTEKGELVQQLRQLHADKGGEPESKKAKTFVEV